MPLRIAFYDAFALFEGSGRAMMDIIDRLDRERFEPVIVCPREGALLAAAAARGYETALVEAVGPLRQYNKALTTGGPWALPGIGLSILRYGLRVRKWLRANGVGLLHCNQTRSILQAGLGGKLAGVPVVWVVRIQDELSASATRFGGWCSSTIVSLAPNCLEGFQGVDALGGKIVEIPLGVDFERFAPVADPSPIPHGLELEPGDRVVLMVGSLHPRKRHDLLLEAAPRILKAVPDARIIIVGEGSDDTGPDHEESLLKRRDELGLADRTTFTGRRDDVPAIMRVCEAFVLPSDQEGLPGVVLEAMATGKPCVVTPAAAAPVLDDITGHVIPPDNADALAEAVIAILGNQDLAEEMGREGRQRAIEVYSLDATVRRYEELYEELAGSGTEEMPRIGPATA